MVKKYIYIFRLLVEKRALNHSVDIRYSIVALTMSLLTVKLKLGLPYRNI